MATRQAEFMTTKGMESTSGEGEASMEGYSFTNRRKSRRKTITLPSYPPILPTSTTSAQSLSESTFSPSSAGPSRARLPPLQIPPTSLEVSKAIDIPDPSPRRTSNRLSNSSPTKASGRLSPTKKYAPMGGKPASGSSTPGGKTRPYGRGIPRTLTLPAHLTDELMRMKISSTTTAVMGDGSPEGLLLDSSSEFIDPSTLGGGDDEGMDVDAPPEAAVERTRHGLTLQLSQRTLRPSQRDDITPSPIKKKRRARSLPPSSPIKTAKPKAEEDANDADDEGGVAEEPDGLLSPTSVTGDQGMEGIQSSPGVLRRSARRTKRPLIDRIGAFVQDIGRGGEEDGMGMVDAREIAYRKRARTRDEGGSEDDGRIGRSKKRRRK